MIHLCEATHVECRPMIILSFWENEKILIFEKQKKNPDFCLICLAKKKLRKAPKIPYRRPIFEGKKKNKKKKAIILDIPLLLEGKINKKSDILVFVEAKKKEINKRLIKRHNFNLKIFKKLKKLQLPLEIKRRKSNFIIKNNFRSLSTRKNVKILKNKILKNERSST